MRHAFTLALALSLAAPQTSLTDLLSRASTYAVDFERRFAAVISAEHYEQHTVGGYERVGARTITAPARDRAIDSEMLFVWLERERAWLAVRNVPAVDLRFLEPDSRPGFSFRLDGEETIGEMTTWKVTFTEERKHTFIQDAPSHGTFWVAPDGVVLRTHLEVARRRDGINGSVTVDYARDPKLQMVVPTAMHEVYTSLAPTGTIVQAESCRRNSLK